MENEDDILAKKLDILEDRRIVLAIMLAENQAEIADIRKRIKELNDQK